MCGITGIAGKNNPALLKDMMRTIVHRGPDDAGEYYDAQVSLGMQRLKIIDLETGHQPIANENKKIWVIFNGEIYNYLELKEQCRKKGHHFYTRTDTEVIVHLYEDYGEDCVHHLQGMFCFAVYDTEKKKLMIARDRMGIKPLYYRCDAGTLYFGSELKTLLADSSWTREIDFHSVYLYLKFLYVPSPHTIYKNTHKLPAGHILTWQDGSIALKKYWDLSFTKKNYKKAELIQQIQHQLRQAVSTRMISDVPLGAFLSGGLDSGSIVACMSEFSHHKVKTFSIGYEEQYASYNEIDFSKKIADHFHCDHEEYIVSPDVVELTHALVKQFDEPFADSSAIPTYLVSKMARKKVTVALSGIGGDELFGGYPRYQGITLSRYYEQLPLPLRKLIAYTASKLPESTASRNIPGWIKRFTRGGTKDILNCYLDWVTFDHEYEQHGLYTDSFLRNIGDKNDIPQKQFFKSDNLDDVLDKVFSFDAQAYLVDDLLVMGDRMSMASSLELRVPMCDHTLVELLASVPEGMRFPGYEKKVLLRDAMKGILPDEIFTRKKQGFMVPLADWIKGPIKPLIDDALNEDKVKKRGYFKPECITWMLEQHAGGKHNFSDQIWSLLNLEMWHQEYMD